MPKRSPPLLLKCTKVKAKTSNAKSDAAKRKDWEIDGSATGAFPPLLPLRCKHRPPYRIALKVNSDANPPKTWILEKSATPQRTITRDVKYSISSTVLKLSKITSVNR